MPLPYLRRAFQPVPVSEERFNWYRFQSVPNRVARGDFALPKTSVSTGTLSTCVLIWEALVTGTAGAGVRDRGQVVEQAHQSGTDSGVVCAAIPAPCMWTV